MRQKRPQPEKPPTAEPPVDLPGAIQGMAGYLQWAEQHGETQGSIIATLSHDIMGLARQEEAICPRTWGYRRHFHP